MTSTPIPAPLPAAAEPPQRFALGTRLGVDFDAVAWAPDAADADLSVACMFEHEAGGAALSGGLLHLDEALGGYLTASRAAGHFEARELDSLLVSRPPAGVRPRALLVIGLGDPDALTARTLERACALAATQALRLGARSVAFAPNLLDSGLAGRPDLHIAASLLRGALAALDLADRTQRRGLAAASTLRTWSFDAGAAHFAAVAQDFARAFATLPAEAARPPGAADQLPGLSARGSPARAGSSRAGSPP